MIRGFDTALSELYTEVSNYQDTLKKMNITITFEKDMIEKDMIVWECRLTFLNLTDRVYLTEVDILYSTLPIKKFILEFISQLLLLEMSGV